MGEAWEWVKTHPVYIVGGVGAIILFYVLYSNMSGTSDQTIVAGSAPPTDAEVQSAAAVQIAQLQAGAATNQLGAQLQAVQSNNATGIAIAQLQATSSNYQVEQAANVQELGITTQGQVQLAGITAQTTIAQYQATVQQHADDLAASVQIANAATYAAIAASQSATDQARITAATTLGLAPYQAAVQLGEQQKELGEVGLYALTAGFTKEYALKDVLLKGAGASGSYVNIAGFTATRGGTPSNFAQNASAVGSALGSLGALF